MTHFVPLELSPAGTGRLVGSFRGVFLQSGGAPAYRTISVWNRAWHSTSGKCSINTKSSPPPAHQSCNIPPPAIRSISGTEMHESQSQMFREKTLGQTTTLEFRRILEVISAEAEPLRFINPSLCYRCIRITWDRSTGRLCGILIEDFNGHFSGERSSAPLLQMHQRQVF